MRWGAHLHNGAAEQTIYDRSGVYRPLGHPARCVQFCFSPPICLSNIEEFAGVCPSREHALCQAEPPLRTAFHRVSLRRNHTCSQLFLTVFLSTPSHLVPGCTTFTYCFPPGFSSPESHLVLSCSLRCSFPHLHTLSQVVPPLRTAFHQVSLRRNHTFVLICSLWCSFPHLHTLSQVVPPLRTAFHQVSLRRNHTLFSVVPYGVPFHTFTPCPRLYRCYMLYFPPGFSSPESHLVLSCSLRCSSPHLVPSSCLLCHSEH